MSLFAHPDASSQASIEAVSVAACLFCAGELTALHTDHGERKTPKLGISRGPGWERWDEVVRRCRRCGWWCRRHETRSEMLDHQGYGGGVMISGAGACLRTLDVSAGETPIQEIRDFLVGKYESRFDVRPRAFEEVVASVFRDLGYRAVVTSFSGDGGIDVFLMKGADTVGVQVKRYEEAIGVAFIRELAGALVQKGLTRGMFVTTSRFTRGVEPAVAEFAMRGHPIELVDPERFFAALELAQFEHYDQDTTDILALSRAKSGVLTSEYRRAL